MALPCIYSNILHQMSMNALITRYVVYLLFALTRTEVLCAPAGKVLSKTEQVAQVRVS